MAFLVFWALFPLMLLSLGLQKPDKGATVKKTLVRIILVVGALFAMSATTAMADGGGNPPLCWPPTAACQ